MDSGATLFKVELLAGQEDTVTNMEIVGWIVFGLILILLFIPVVRAILKIMRTCNQQTGSYNLNCSPEKGEGETNKVTYKHISLPEVVQSSSPLMEKT